MCVCVCVLSAGAAVGRMNYKEDINVKRGLQHKSGAEVGAAIQMVVMVVSPVPV